MFAISVKEEDIINDFEFRFYETYICKNRIFTWKKNTEIDYIHRDTINTAIDALNKWMIQLYWRKKNNAGHDIENNTELTTEFPIYKYCVRLTIEDLDALDEEENCYDAEFIGLSRKILTQSNYAVYFHCDTI